MNKKIKYIVGIDEVGRGPLAGPVTIGLIVTKCDFDKESFIGIKDSKKLNSIKREGWVKKINYLKKRGFLNYTISHASSKEIDKKGISNVINFLIKKSLKKLDIKPKETLILLDGGLKAPNDFIYQKTIIKGDEKEIVISMASILAKVSRDKKMINYSNKYKEYGFEKHKGYGTKEHINLIKKFGPSEIHRLSFLSRII